MNTSEQRAGEQPQPKGGTSLTKQSSQLIRTRRILPFVLAMQAALFSLGLIIHELEKPLWEKCSCWFTVSFQGLLVKHYRRILRGQKGNVQMPIPMNEAEWGAQNPPIHKWATHEQGDFCISPSHKTLFLSSLRQINPSILNMDFWVQNWDLWDPDAIIQLFFQAIITHEKNKTHIDVCQEVFITIWQDRKYVRKKESKNTPHCLSVFYLTHYNCTVTFLTFNTIWRLRIIRLPDFRSTANPY